MSRELFAIIILLTSVPLYAIHIAVIGCGYVGLTCTAIFAQAGHTIYCIDIDQNKIDTLKHKQLPFYEPGLGQIVFDAYNDHRITFATTLDHIPAPDVYYICVPTPIGPDGSCDRSYLYAAYDTILHHIPDHTNPIICIKSTVAPGTLRVLSEYKSGHTSPQLVYNPEFMREGSALRDMYTCNPIVLGGESQAALATIRTLLQEALPQISQVITTNFETAELIKYAWNSFSAIRIAYINELARLCRCLGADIVPVTQALACSEQLLQTKDLKPGPGYGGSCLPKDTRAFGHVLAQYGLDTTLVHRAVESNICHKQQLVIDICNLIQPTRSQQTITLLGLTFKANTNDIRHSLALDIIPVLLEQGVRIKAYDPQGMAEMKQLFPQVHYCTDAYDAIEESDGIVVLTEWPEFRDLDLGHVASLCKKKCIIDTRNIYSPALLKSHGFNYITMGTV